MPPRDPVTQLDTHEVTNQPPPLVDYNLYGGDSVLREALHREGEIGETVVAGKGLSDQAQGAHIETRLRRVVGIECGVLQPAARGHSCNQIPAGGVDIAVVDIGELCLGPAFQFNCKRSVPVFEERPLQKGFVGVHAQRVV